MPRILLVDDSVPFLRSLAALLAAKGYRADTAVGGAEALCRLRDDGFDVVLLDMRMPGMNGQDVLNNLPRPLPVIVVTSDQELVPKPPPPNVRHVIGKSVADDDFIDRLLRAVADVAGPGTAETGALQ